MEVLLPRTLEEALEMKASHPSAVPIAGFADLIGELNFDLLRPEALLDVSRLPEIGTWRQQQRVLSIGAGVSFTRVLAELPQHRALAEASRSVGSPQIRNRGTLGGNLGTASPAGDALPVLAAHDAEVGLVSAARGERWVPWDAFLVGVKRTSMAADELILGARWRVATGPQSYSKIGTRNAMVIAVASLCFAMDVATRSVRVALGSVAPTVVRAPEAETFLTGELNRSGAWDEPATVLPDGTAEAFADRVVEAARPIDDVRGTAAYRRHAIRVLARRALGWATRERATEAMVG